MTGTGFFDSYPEFFNTSTTWAVPNRLNRRYEALIGRNAERLAGASVVDLGSHDGRWSFAALKTGARHVVGLEARARHIDNAEATMARYGIERDRYRFMLGDAHETLRALAPGSADVVLCFGFFNETLRHTELLTGVMRLAPRYLFLDVWIHPRTTDPVIRLYVEDPNLESSSFPFYSATGNPVVGHPSLSALELLLTDAGFGQLDYYDWPAQTFADWNDLEDYRERRRMTLVATNMATGLER